MKNTKMNRILITILCFAMVISLSATVLATTTIGDIEIRPTTPTDTTATDIGNSVIGILQVVGIIISVIVLMILGIKYMMGSAEEKAEYKKTFIPYIVGAVLVFAASALAKTLYNWISGISTT